MTSFIAMALCAGLLSSAVYGSAEPAPDKDDARAKDAAAVTLNIGYSYGLGYAPLILCQENGFIEKAYYEATGNTADVEWTLISSGPDINTGLASGSLDVGFMGIAPAIIGVSKDVGFRIFTTVSGQEHGLMTNDPDIHSLGDLIGSPDQIALANIGSIQHIILGLALEANGYDAHALDSNLAAMKHPDGMAALEAGSVSCNVTTSPYIFMERKNESLHELDEVKNVWSADRTYVVGVASEELYDTDPELYQALCKGISDSVDLMNSDMEAAAAITCAYDGNSPEDELEYLKAGKYFTSMKGVFELAEQMYAGQFIEKDFASFSELVFDNVTGD